MSTPLTLPGYMDDGQLFNDGYGIALDYLLEQVPELQHPLSIRTFARMRHEPQLAAICRAYVLAMTRGNWTIDGDGCDDEVTQRIADDLGLPIKGTDPKPTGARRRGFTWAKHLRLACALRLTFGHAPFAQQWQPEGDGMRLAMVQERMPQTIAAIRLNDGDGTLKGAEQYGSTGGNPDQMIRTANHQLVWYAREREGSNYFGQSLLREAFGPWLIKDQMLRVHASSIRRFGMGILEVQAPPGATPQQIAEAQRYASSIKASEVAGAGVPNGFTTALRGMQGNVPDALAFITYLDRQMTRSTLTSILDMATAERGSRSLGETVMQLMIYAQQAEAQGIAEDATEQIVIPLVDANWGADEPSPRINVADVGSDEQLTAQDLNWLFQYGGLNPDDVLEEHTRQRYSLPPIDKATRRVEITDPEPVDPTAPTPAPAAVTEAS